jgi:hypothetical protein
MVAQSGFMRAAGLVLGAMLLVSVAQTRADEIKAKPATVQFGAEDKQEEQGRTCSLLTTIVDPSRPEVVNLRLFHVLSPTALYFGFSIDVGEMRYRNGKPVGRENVTLASGDVTTDSFDSDGRMYGAPVRGGGVIKSTTDAETARTLWLGVLSGSFALRMRRATSGAQPRTYLVSTPPSREALGRYLACSLAIRDLALGDPASPEFYAKVRKGGAGFSEPLKVPASPDHPIATVIPPVSEEGPLVGNR